MCIVFVFFFKQKTAYEMRISDWSSDVCSSDLASKKIGDDRYVILFSNSRSPNGEISLASSSDRASFTLDLDALPASIDRIVFTATHDDRPIAESRPLTVSIDQGKAEFNVAEHLSNEQAVMMLELYRPSSGWRCGTIAQGFRSEEH